MASNPKTKSALRIPPQDIEAEKALLGSIMLHPEILGEILDNLERGACYLQSHNIILDAMIDLYNLGQPIDLITVSSRLKELVKLEQIGGSTYLTELINTVPSASGAEHYAGIVQRKHMLRNLIDAANHISEVAYEPDVDAEFVLDKAGKRLMDIAGHTKHGYLHLKDTLHGVMEQFDALSKNGDDIRGIPTGFKNLDKKLSGLQKSDLIILAARPSMGKTALAIDIARGAARSGKGGVAIFSLEMSAGQLANRMLASQAFVDSNNLRNGRVTDHQELENLQHALGELSALPIYIDDNAQADILAIKRASRRIQRDNSLGLIIIDYLQLLLPRRNYDSMVHQISEISRSLKALARDLDVPVLALSQLNRNVETRGGAPKLSDLRDSGSIEQDADVVMFIHREETDKELNKKSPIANIIIAKHRNGPVGVEQLTFDERRVSFIDKAPSSFGEF